MPADGSLRVELAAVVRFVIPSADLTAVHSLIVGTCDHDGQGLLAPPVDVQRVPS